ncbi:MAG TPA: beta-ketoacyl-ACP synthase III [Coxiellaceae bacterium]|nr:beta-ketoacyl-ACP synthase III [Coxiellaceae bacterium]
MTFSQIAGTGSYLPSKILTNADLEKMVDTTDEWIMKRVGIKERHIIGPGESTSSMAVQAARQAIEAAGISPEEIDLIIVGTATPDKLFPSTACYVQKTLNLPGVPAFDLNAACSGFIYSLSVADQFIRNNTYKTILVIGADALSRLVDWNDRSTCVLFGDGAGAVVLRAATEPGILIADIHADATYTHLLYAENNLWEYHGPSYVNMEGNEVFKIAVLQLGDMVDRAVEKAGLQKSDVDWLIPHQANLRIITAAAKRLGLPMERVVLTVHNHGNTSAASIPLALDVAIRRGQIKRGETLLLEAFGAGFAWGSALIRY